VNLVIGERSAIVSLKKERREGNISDMPPKDTCGGGKNEKRGVLGRGYDKQERGREYFNAPTFGSFRRQESAKKSQLVRVLLSALCRKDGVSRRKGSGEGDAHEGGQGNNRSPRLFIRLERENTEGGELRGEEKGPRKKKGRTGTH